MTNAFSSGNQGPTACFWDQPNSEQEHPDKNNSINKIDFSIKHCETRT